MFFFFKSTYNCSHRGQSIENAEIGRWLRGGEEEEEEGDKKKEEKKKQTNAGTESLEPALSFLGQVTDLWAPTRRTDFAFIKGPASVAAAAQRGRQKSNNFLIEILAEFRRLISC